MFRVGKPPPAHGRERIPQGWARLQAGKPLGSRRQVQVRRGKLLAWPVASEVKQREQIKGTPRTEDSVDTGWLGCDRQAIGGWFQPE